MPIKKAAFRALRKSKKNAKRNKSILENMRYLIKQNEKTLAQKNIEKARENVAKTIQAIDRAVQKGILKKNTAARKKSQIMRKLSAHH